MNMDTSFCEVRPNDIGTVNKWFRQCQARNIPYVVVTHRAKYSKVAWDHVSLPKEADSKLEAAARAMTDQLKAIFRRHANPKSTFMFSAGVGEFDKLLPAQARAAANEIYHVLYENLCA